MVPTTVSTAASATVSTTVSAFNPKTNITSVFSGASRPLLVFVYSFRVVGGQSTPSNHGLLL